MNFDSPEYQNAIREVQAHEEYERLQRVKVEDETRERWMRYGQRVDMLRRGEAYYVTAPGFKTYLAGELLWWLTDERSEA